MLSGFVCTNRPEVPGSNPKHTTFYGQILYSICHCIEKKAENKQKIAGFGPY